MKAEYGPMYAKSSYSTDKGNEAFELKMASLPDKIRE